MSADPRQLNRAYRAGVTGVVAVSILGLALASAGSANEARPPAVVIGDAATTPVLGVDAGAPSGSGDAAAGVLPASGAAPLPGTSAGVGAPVSSGGRGPTGGGLPVAAGPASHAVVPGQPANSPPSGAARPAAGRPAVSGRAGGGRPSAAATGGATGGAAQPVPPPGQLAAQAAASDVGVFADHVDVGFIILPSSQYKQYGATDQQEEAAIRAIEADINAHGGLGGRKLHAIVVGDTNPLSANGGTAACNSLVNGSKVFMVIDEALPGGPDCVAHAGRPVLDTGYSSEDNATKAQLDQDSPYYWITGEVTDNMIPQWLQFVAKDKSLGRAERYAIVVAAAHPGFKAAADLLTQLAPSYGINIVTTFTASDDTSTAQLQCQQGINQFKANNVTAEFPIDNPVAIGFGMNCSAGQNTTAAGKKVKYTLSSVGAMDSTSGSSLYTNDFDGTRGISQNHIPDSPTNAHCKDVISKAGIPFTTIQANYCETMGVMAEVFRRIPANQPVSASTWINQIANLRGYTGNAQDTLNFAPDKHWGSDGVLTYQYHGGANGTTTEESGFVRGY